MTRAVEPRFIRIPDPDFGRNGVEVFTSSPIGTSPVSCALIFWVVGEVLFVSAQSGEVGKPLALQIVDLSHEMMKMVEIQ